jgi:hypothetical protein
MMDSMGEGWTGDAEIILPAVAGQSVCIHKPLQEIISKSFQGGDLIFDVYATYLLPSRYFVYHIIP